jgi:hypothetical protein
MKQMNSSRGALIVSAGSLRNSQPSTKPPAMSAELAASSQPVKTIGVRQRHAVGLGRQLLRQGLELDRFEAPGRREAPDDRPELLRACSSWCELQQVPLSSIAVSRRPACSSARPCALPAG